MMFSQLEELLVPDIAAQFLRTLCEHTGLKWGVTPANLFWFQSPKTHIALFLLMMLYCAMLYNRSKDFPSAARAQLSARGVGRSTRCPLNRFMGILLLLCLGAQIYVKAIRPKPFIQLGWLLMPCHVFTAVWALILLRDQPKYFGANSYLATLMVDWMWAPIGAALAPDWGDHQFAFEGSLFAVHHGLLVLLPVYYATRYGVLGLSTAHIFHFTLVPIFVSFAIYTPYALLTGLNLNYMLYPPKLGGGAPAIFSSTAYRPAMVGLFIILSVLSNETIQILAKVLRRLSRSATKAKQKIK